MSKIAAALDEMGPVVREGFLAHIRGGTSANYLADWLTRAGCSVGATTVKDFRKKVLSAGR